MTKVLLLVLIFFVFLVSCNPATGPTLTPIDTPESTFMATISSYPSLTSTPLPTSTVAGILSRAPDLDLVPADEDQITPSQYLEWIIPPDTLPSGTYAMYAMNDSEIWAFSVSNWHSQYIGNFNRGVSDTFNITIFNNILYLHSNEIMLIDSLRTPDSVEVMIWPKPAEYRIRFSPDGQWIIGASLHEDGTKRFVLSLKDWSAYLINYAISDKYQAGWFGPYQVSAHLLSLATYDSENQIIQRDLISPDEGIIVSTCEPYCGHAISPDGQWLVWFIQGDLPERTYHPPVSETENVMIAPASCLFDKPMDCKGQLVKIGQIPYFSYLSTSWLPDSSGFVWAGGGPGDNRMELGILYLDGTGKSLGTYAQADPIEWSPNGQWLFAGSVVITSAGQVLNLPADYWEWGFLGWLEIP